jgi:glycosyltransferase involved in cell wall biosynthesis
MVAPYFRPIYSGAGQLVYDFGRYLPGLGVEVRIVAANLAGAKKTEWMAGMLVERLRPLLGRALTHVTFLIQLNCYLWRRRKQFDVLHLHGAYFSLLGVLPLVRMLGKKTVLTFHDPNGDMPEIIAKRRGGAWQLRLLVSIDKLVHTTSFAADSYGRLGLPPDKLRLIPCGIDTEGRFFPAAAEERARLRAARSLPAGAKIGVFTGAVLPRKGVDVLVEAWRRVLDRCPGAMLLIVGPLDIVEDQAQVDFVDRLRKRIDQLGLREAVRLVGRFDKVEEYLRLADLFVFASRQETFGISLIEGMACGLPSVVAAIEGVSADILDHESEGLLVGQEDPEAFADAVTRLLNDPDLAREIGLRAVEKVRRKFSIKSISRQHNELYRELLS